MIFYPDISKEWHSTLNGLLDPSKILPGTSVRFWWKCSRCGNEWKATPRTRIKGHGCDVCAWKKRKIARHNFDLKKGFSLLSFKCVLDWDYELNEHTPDYYPSGSSQKVSWKCHVCGHRWKARICNRTRDYKSGCPACSNRITVKGKNDLLTTNPELCEEWDYVLNGDLKPSDIAQWSHNKVWWKCKKCSYSYLATPSNRVFGKGCPCCRGRVVVPNINDLATVRPDLAMDWHPTLNGNLTPVDVTKGRGKIVWWKCHVCGNEWRDSISHRSSGRGCSICNKLKKKH